MLTKFRAYLYYTFFNDFIIFQQEEHDQELKTLKTINEKQKHKLQHYEDLLANKNAKAVAAQQLYVTEHAIHRYKERIGFNGSDDELRKMIYKLTLRHLATMDKLPDGHYKINDKAAVRVADNTIQTVIPAKRRQS